MTISKIENNFSRHAHLYDKHAHVQSLAADELIRRLGSKRYKRILDIGCGTGNYTRILHQMFKDARITALDISREMIDAAKKKCGNDNIEFIVADAEENWDSPSPREDHALGQPLFFDLITSNATFQWLGDFGRVMKKYKNLIEPGGRILFSIFGPLTYRELAQSLKDALGSKTSISAEKFLNKSQLSEVMGRNFPGFSIEERIIEKEHSALIHLLNSIKYTGTRGGGVDALSNGNRSVFDRIEEAYISKFGAIKASYQIFYCEARR